MKRKKEARRQRVCAVVDGVISAYRETSGDTDVLGMYTGISHLSDTTGAPTSAIAGGKVCLPHPEVPVQDADDL